MTLLDLGRELRAAIRQDIADKRTTQTRIAREACLTQGNVSNVLHGKRKATLYTLSVIAEAAGIGIEFRLVRTEQQHQENAETSRPAKLFEPRQFPPPRRSHNLNHPWNNKPRKLEQCPSTSQPAPRP